MSFLTHAWLKLNAFVQNFGANYLIPSQELDRDPIRCSGVDKNWLNSCGIDLAPGQRDSEAIVGVDLYNDPYHWLPLYRWVHTNDFWEDAGGGFFLFNAFNKLKVNASNFLTELGFQIASFIWWALAWVVRLGTDGEAVSNLSGLSQINTWYQKYFLALNASGIYIGMLFLAVLSACWGYFWKNDKRAYKGVLSSLFPITIVFVMYTAAQLSSAPEEEEAYAACIDGHVSLTVSAQTACNNIKPSGQVPGSPKWVYDNVLNITGYISEPLFSVVGQFTDNSLTRNSSISTCDAYTAVLEQRYFDAWDSRFVNDYTESANRGLDPDTVFIRSASRRSIPLLVSQFWEKSYLAIWGQAQFGDSAIERRARCLVADWRSPSVSATEMLAIWLTTCNAEDYIYTSEDERSTLSGKHELYQLYPCNNPDWEKLKDQLVQFNGSALEVNPSAKAYAEALFAPNQGFEVRNALSTWAICDFINVDRYDPNNQRLVQEELNVGNPNTPFWARGIKTVAPGQWVSDNSELNDRHDEFYLADGRSRVTASVYPLSDDNFVIAVLEPQYYDENNNFIGSSVVSVDTRFIGLTDDTGDEFGNVSAIGCHSWLFGNLNHLDDADNEINEESFARLQEIGIEKDQEYSEDHHPFFPITGDTVTRVEVQHIPLNMETIQELNNVVAAYNNLEVLAFDVNKAPASTKGDPANDIANVSYDYCEHWVLAGFPELKDRFDADTLEFRLAARAQDLRDNFNVTMGHLRLAMINDCKEAIKIAAEDSDKVVKIDDPINTFLQYRDRHFIEVAEIAYIPPPKKPICLVKEGALTGECRLGKNQAGYDTDSSQHGNADAGSPGLSNNFLSDSIGIHADKVESINPSLVNLWGKQTNTFSSDGLHYVANGAPSAEIQEDGIKVIKSIAGLRDDNILFAGVAVFAAGATFWSIAGLSLGAAFSEIILAILIGTLPITLLVASMPFKKIKENNFPKKIVRLAFFAAMSNFFFMLFLTGLIVIMDIVYSIVGQIAFQEGDLLNSLILAASPILAIKMVRIGASKIGLDVSSFKGSFSTAAGFVQSGTGQGLYPDKYDPQAFYNKTAQKGVEYQQNVPDSKGAKTAPKGVKAPNVGKAVGRAHLAATSGAHAAGKILPQASNPFSKGSPSSQKGAKKGPKRSK